MTTTHSLSLSLYTAAAGVGRIRLLSNNELYNFIEKVPGGFQCGLCGKITKDRSNMRRHMVIRHSEPTNEHCLACDRVFTYRYYLLKHLRTPGECTGHAVQN